ncbi:hypothetical protein SFC66_04525 [Terribacillus saccharophilus]|uniref:hypothetical protein n=1 Tax=Terribacillus saccharophilus TaxID=361277 RepID=UPI0039825D24
MIRPEDNLLPIHSYVFFTDVIVVNWGSNDEKKKFALVSVKKINPNSGAQIKVIHPISQFILEKYNSRGFNTMRKYSNHLVTFLNYIQAHKTELKMTSITQLKLSHGVQFLNDLGNGKITGKKKAGGKRSARTVSEYERTLTNFFSYLSKKGFLPEIPLNIFQKKEMHIGDSRVNYIESPFKGVIYPAPAKDKKEHLFPLKYFPLLLEISILEAPRIALGIYMQFMGGLRCGEIVNLSRTQVTKRIKNGDFLISIKDRNYRFDIKDHTSSEVKRVRYQEVFNIKDWLTVLFNDHVLLYRTIDGTDALFVNSHGKAMTAKSYNQYFNKVKTAFCDYLNVYGDADDIVVANHLRTVDWSSHIGRGTFTNMIAERTDNPFLIAYKRGDKKISSALPYIAKTTRLRQKIEEAFSNLNNSYIPNLVERRNKNGY